MVSKITSLVFQEIQLTRDEEFYKSSDVWAFDLKYLWITLFAILIVYLVPLTIWIKIPLYAITLWYGGYSFRQNWRLSLTNKRIIARRLYPRPLSYFLTRVHNFPYKHLEGMSTGPRNNIALFMAGLFIAANLGINLLKSSLFTDQLELPDTLEFIIFLMVLLPPFRNDGETISSDLELWYQQFAQDILQIIGFSALLIGVILILVSFPWKQYLVLRVRYAKDFKLNTSVSNEFIKDLYTKYYEKETTKVPKRFEKWHYPWFEGEVVEEVADMEQIAFLNRIIGSFALITTSISLWVGIRDIENFSSTEFILWSVVAFLDIVVIFLSIRFSTRESEFVITNYRIIFAQEVKQLSGATGRRYFFISDLNRDDIASFDFRKVTSFALEYLLASIIALYVGAVLIFSGLELLGIIFTIFSILLFFFVYQTYVGFSLKTKSGDNWVMRHQLANPATRLRQFVGTEQNVFTRLLANRLEEKEIINAVQVLRSSQLGLQARKFENDVEHDIDTTVVENPIEKEFQQKTFLSKRFSKKKLSKRKRIQLSLEDILLKDEEVIWEKVIPFPLNWKFLTLFSATVMFVITLPAMFIVALNFELDVQNYTLQFTNINPFLTFICIITAGIMYFIFQLKYFSLRRKSMVITKNRVFYEELVRPPKWLFFLGIFKESYIRESMIDQLQIVGSGTYVLGGFHWDRFIMYLKQTIVRSILYFLTFNLSLLVLSYWSVLPASTEIYYIIRFSLFMLGIMIVWSSSNMVVHLIQSWPTLEIDATGIGVTFRLPYLTQKEAEQAQYILLSGVGSIEIQETYKRKMDTQRKLLQKKTKKGGKKV